MEDSPMYAADIRALTMRADEWAAAADELAQHLAVLTLAAEALTARAERAEARVKELTAELAEQEVGKLELIRQIFARPQ